MGRVLYEASSFNFSFFYLIPVIMMIYIPIVPFLIRKRFYPRYTQEQKDQYDSKGSKTFRTIFLSAAFVFVLLLSIPTYLGIIDMYNKVVKAYQQGNYEVVEGYVENFDPMPYSGHKRESFDVNGVSFSYSDYVDIQGYNITKSHGGVITGDGQHLRIGYVYYNKSYGNIIVYIEELD